MVEQTLLDALCEILDLPKGALKGDEDLGSLGSWDSLAIMGLIAYADEQCGVSLSPASLLSCKTVSEVAQMVSRAA